MPLLVAVGDVVVGAVEVAVVVVCVEVGGTAFVVMRVKIRNTEVEDIQVEKLNPKYIQMLQRKQMKWLTLSHFPSHLHLKYARAAKVYPWVSNP